MTTKTTVRPNIEAADWQFINGKRKPGESFKQCFHRLLSTYRAALDAVHSIAVNNNYRSVVSHLDDLIVAGEL